MNKTTEALKLAEEALTGLTKNDSVNAYFADKRNKALAAIREVLADHSGDANERVSEPVSNERLLEAAGYTKKAEPVKQEPVADVKCQYCGDEMSPKGHDCSAPVDAKAIRAEALEEAAKRFEGGDVGNVIAIAIRGLK